MTAIDELWSSKVMDLRDFFENAVLEGGIAHLDRELCQDFADGLHDIFEAVAAMEAFARAHLALGQPASEEPPPRRSLTQRRALAQAAVALDLEERILAFPVVARPRPVFRTNRDSGDETGGDAA